MQTVNILKIPTMGFDILVIGSGIAACRAAIEAASEGAEVAMVTKGAKEESNSFEAQGGIAVVIDEEDSFESHVQDTLKAGAGLCDEDMVRKLVSDGSELVKQLIDWKVPFDSSVSGRLLFGLEGAHSRPRILHANGDQTGKTVQIRLLQIVSETPGITIFQKHFAADLLQQNGEVIGALVFDLSGRRYMRFLAKGTILATGGTGRLYRETTNPKVTTGDGMAMAFRAGCALEDMEFLQFHPTVFYVAGAPRYLISEAVRGDGAVLVNSAGERFMSRYDSERADLAARDIVSRAIIQEMARTNTPAVFLDLSPIKPDKVKERFPNILAFCSRFGIDITTDKVPVCPAMHYMMGGVKTDATAFTGLPRLFAAGEVACTGVHGANRLASNSLLEGLVFGREAGRNAAALEPVSGGYRSHDQHFSLEEMLTHSNEIPIDVNDVHHSLVSLMWRTANIFREEKRLRSAEKMLEFWNRYSYHNIFKNIAGFELINMLQLGRVINRGAMKRTESRGAHYRKDYPNTDDENWKRHIEFHREDFKLTLDPA